METLVRMALKYIQSRREPLVQAFDEAKRQLSTHNLFCLFGRLRSLCSLHGADKRWLRRLEVLIRECNQAEQELLRGDYKLAVPFFVRDRPELADELRELWKERGGIDPDARYILDSGNPNWVAEDLLSHRERNRAELAAYAALVVEKKHGLVAELLLGIDRPFTSDEREQLREIATRFAPAPSLPWWERLIAANPKGQVSEN